ncbi:hybrid sensor histidine kinase/response regulator [Natrinema sp. CBA1119]|uniref:PAS domain S-box protein n=1 Tax=Natrinema sp. CBA1119 TaxID=1608465 RepID=UPI000BF8CBB6|nr:PAS domain S-box protein [Natrinema sp. CBA1119]PGF16325.1 hybrid sensor histidine kinase/response regulator [Natrinema sp. CBA1119]
MTGGIHVLCVDDDPDFRELTATVLERRNDDIDVQTARSGRDGLAVFDEGHAEPDREIDCIVSDYEMPDMDGLELLAAVRKRDRTMPFILFTGKGSETIASEAISAGVTDYLQKGTSDQYTVLANRIENAVEKRRADRARRESERELEQYRVLVETASDAMYVLDDAGRVTIANDAFCDLLDVDHDRVVGSHISTFISRDSFERGIKTVHQLHSGGGESDYFECVLETSTDGQRVYEANVSVITDDTGEFAGSTAVIRDVTSRKQRERELAQYERIIELAPTALFILDADGSIDWCNDEFADAFAEEKAALLGTPFPELVDRGYYDEQVMSKYAEEVRTLLSSTSDRDRAKYQIQFYSADDTVLVHDVHTKLLPLEDGEFAGTIHAIRDITRRRHYRRELERQNDRLEEFTSLVSHDLRNPLNVAQGHLELLDERTDGQHVDKMRWSLSRMEELVDGLLELARQGKTIGEQEWLPLASAAREAWSTVDTGDARLEIDTDIEIYGDEARIRTLLENLFRNAVEHSSTNPASQAQQNPVEHSSTSPDSQARQDTVEHRSTGDQLDSRADDTEEHETDGDHDGANPIVVTVGSLEAGDHAAGNETRPNGFYVEDTGPGLPADRESLFEFGYTTEADGTGLGLAIVDGIVTAHDWSITARDGSSGGARFEIDSVRTATADADGGLAIDGETETDGTP